MLIEKYRKGLVGDKDYNCAEKVVNLANEVWELGIAAESLKMAAGFGAGLGCGQLCGAIAAAAMIISVKNVKTVAKASQLYAIERSMVEEVEKRLGSLQCSELKAKFYHPESKCEFIIETVIEILDDYR